MRCPNCGREAPPGGFCGYCGARLPRSAGQEVAPREVRRSHAYAANPGEHVFAPAIVSTLFPHLPPHRLNLARWLIAGGVALALGIAAGRYAPIALVLSAALLPVLYLIYFYDVEVYEDEPVTVLAGTFIAGAILGAALILAFYRTLVANRPLSIHANGPSVSYLLINALALPLLGLALSLAGPLALYLIPRLRARFDDILDGMVFGVASGLGFAAAQSVVYSWQIITGPLQRGGSAFDWALPAVRVALLTPIIYACAAGMVCGALWLARDPRVRQRPRSLLTSPGGALLIAAVGVLAPALLTDLFPGTVTSFLWNLLAAGALLLAARVSLHLGLLEKGAEEGDASARMVVCHTCGRLTPDLAFCSHCGVALRAGSKRAARRAARAAEGGPQ
ncbi:MAG TPA: PrsW family glutamic-type intramembrane protease [Ktedonobacterales bacterium]